jgi:hypothetical protein
MVCFRTKNPSLGKFWSFLRWKMLAYFLPFGLFYGHWKYFMALWYNLWQFGIFPRFGILNQEKSGNPGAQAWLNLFFSVSNSTLGPALRRRFHL